MTTPEADTDSLEALEFVGVELILELMKGDSIPNIISVPKYKTAIFPNLAEFFSFNELITKNEIRSEIFQSMFGSYPSIYRAWSKHNIMFIYENGDLDLSKMLKEVGLDIDKGFYAFISFFIDCDGNVRTKMEKRRMPFLTHRQNKINMLLNEYNAQLVQETRQIQTKQKILDCEIKMLKADIDVLRKSLNLSRSTEI